MLSLTVAMSFRLACQPYSGAHFLRDLSSNVEKIATYLRYLFPILEDVHDKITFGGFLRWVYGILLIFSQDEPSEWSDLEKSTVRSVSAVAFYRPLEA